MKSIVLFHPVEGTGPVWRNGFSPTLDILSEFSDVHLLEAPWPSLAKQSRLQQRLTRRLHHRKTLANISAQIQLTLSPEVSEPTLLFAIALRASQVELASALAVKMGDAVTTRVLYVVENIEPEHVSTPAWQVFDRIVCFCPDLSVKISNATKVSSIYWPAHVDTLLFNNTNEYRPIDLLAFGRVNTNILFEVQHRFQVKGSNRLCIDFTTRPQGDRMQSARREFNLLVDTLSKSRAALCFTPDNVPRFNGRSPLLGRWAYAWAAGCTVFGTRPMAMRCEEHMNWEGAIVDLPLDPEDAANVIESHLADRARSEHQSQLNMLEATRRHDTAYRFERLLGDLNIELPEALTHRLERLAQVVEQKRRALLN